MEAETTVKMTVTASLAEWMEIVEVLNSANFSNPSTFKLIKLIEGE